MQDAIAEEQLSVNGPHSAAVFSTTFVDINWCQIYSENYQAIEQDIVGR